MKTAQDYSREKAIAIHQLCNAGVPKKTIADCYFHTLSRIRQLDEHGERILNHRNQYERLVKLRGSDDIDVEFEKGE